MFSLHSSAAANLDCCLWRILQINHCCHLNEISIIIFYQGEVNAVGFLRFLMILNGEAVTQY